MKRILVLAGVFLALCGTPTSSEAQIMKDNPLTAKQQAMVIISAYSATGDLDNLKTALAEGLEAGLTVNEIKEMLVQVYAYAGFPRSLNAIGVLMALLDERAAQGISDEPGREATPPPANWNSLEAGTANQTRLIGRPVSGGMYDFAPAIDQFLKAHLFGDIFQRDALDWLSRELVTISILASIEGLNPQLQGHYQIAMHNGLTLEQAQSFVTLLSARMGRKVGNNAAEVLQRAIRQ